MAVADGGGDKGIVTLTITHPKLIGGDVVVPVGSVDLGEQESMQAPVVKTGLVMDSDTGVSMGPEIFTEGEVLEEEEDVIEVVLEEDEVQKAG
ncbi:hypothetical protein OsI_23287 [Oryza sativa Indica Group]|jgi:ethanolamine utilization microcompartment shell protein EutS|uniref:Uncharacterized protein n=1 Tax=Oryza sativa subsp. indica TaxID=39946 RepID=A2YDV1_ORYSI|nr:hypothetical protein OsI_23287 [Oryza sativa Indica Group]